MGRRSPFVDPDGPWRSRSNRGGTGSTKCRSPGRQKQISAKPNNSRRGCRPRGPAPTCPCRASVPQGFAALRATLYMPRSRHPHHSCGRLHEISHAAVRRRAPVSGSKDLQRDSLRDAVSGVTASSRRITGSRCAPTECMQRVIRSRTGAIEPPTGGPRVSGVAVPPGGASFFAGKPHESSGERLTRAKVPRLGCTNCPIPPFRFSIRVNSWPGCKTGQNCLNPQSFTRVLGSDHHAPVTP